MICYLDSSALVKRYFNEPGSAAFRQFLGDAQVIGSASISRAEIVAAFSRSVRQGLVAHEVAEAARRILQIDWKDVFSMEVSEAVIDRATDLVWRHGLRGYDSVQLAAAVTWQETLDTPMSFATFDSNLWQAAAREGLAPYPHERPGIR